MLLEARVIGAFQGPLGLHFLRKMVSGDLAFPMIKAYHELHHINCCTLPDYRAHCFQALEVLREEKTEQLSSEHSGRGVK